MDSVGDGNIQNQPQVWPTLGYFCSSACGGQRLRQHDHPIFAALCITHDDHVVVKIHSLDTKAHALHESHACAIEQAEEPTSE